MSGREVHLATTIERIKSSSATERKDGLSDLDHILRYNKDKHKLDGITDKTWHGIYESLFQCAAAERSAFMRTSHSQSSRNKATARLAACGKALRTSLNIGVQNIRIKTVKAVLGHILHTLPTSNGLYCPGLAADYIKCLRIILEHEVHVEHLRETWDDVLLFCLDGLKPVSSAVAAANDGDEAEPEATPGASVLRTSLLSISRRSRAGTPLPVNASRGPIFRTEGDDLVTCVYQLVRSTNAAVAGHEITVVTSLIAFMKGSGSSRQSGPVALAAINCIFSRISFGSLESTRRLMLDVYPLIKNLWSTTRSMALKQEMLITLVLTKHGVAALVNDESQASFRVDLEQLYQILRSDYDKRLERDQLQLDNLVLDASPSPADVSVLRSRAFRLRNYQFSPSNRADDPVECPAEGMWTIVYLIAFYAHVLDARRLLIVITAKRDEEGVISKRSKLSLIHQDLLHDACSLTKVSERIAALQYIVFLLQICPLTEVQIDQVLTSLLSCTADAEKSVAIWGMIACACCAFQRHAKALSLQGKWLDCFKTAARAISTSACCRPACFLLHVLLGSNIIPYAAVSLDIDTVFTSTTLHGPTILSDASLALWNTLMEARAAHKPGTAGSMAEQLVPWLFSRWTPSNLEDRAYVAHISADVRPDNIASFLRRLCGQRFLSVGIPVSMVCGPVAQSWMAVENAKEVTAFLGLENETQFLLTSLEVLETVNPDISPNATRLHWNTSSQILDACITEIDRLSASWVDSTTNRPHSLLPEMVGMMVGAIIVVHGFIVAVDDRLRSRIDQLVLKAETLIRYLSMFLLDPECEQPMIDSVLFLVADALPSVENLRHAEDKPRDRGLLISLSVHISEVLEMRRKVKDALAANHDLHTQPLEDDFETQKSEPASKDQAIAIPRDLNSIICNIDSFRYCLAAYTHFISDMLHSSVEVGRDDSIAFVPPTFIRYLGALSPVERCAIRPILLRILESDLVVDDSAIEELFDSINEMLESDETDRHEIVLLLQLDILRDCALQWTDDEAERSGTWREAADDIYIWFLDQALPKGLCTVNVSARFSDLLFTLLSIRGPEYKPKPELQSVRTCIFNLIESSEVIVKYHLAKDIPNLFAHITLGAHEKAFKDLHEKIMYSESWLEGLALRILLLANLGSRWHTLLRRSIYHIFETAGTVPRTEAYAARCIASVTRSLELAGPKSLFRLYASQMLFTWLRNEDGALETIPYSIFGYESVEALLRDVQDEAYAQALMRNDVKELASLSHKVGIGQEQLARGNFAKAAAYSLANDPTIKPENSRQRSELTLLSLMRTKDHFVEMFGVHFAKILGLLLLRSDFERIDTASIFKDRAVKDETFKANTRTALDAMKSINSSTVELPDAVQPIFSGKRFLSVVDRLARRIKTEIAMVWHSTVYVFVLRLLFDNLHHAMGSLHACQIVRKIRLLVALSGRTPLEGYALEMTLHGLRPLLTDRICADDTLGIVQYLYNNGINYLQKNISFIAGMNVTTLIALRKFVDVAQESTTQQSQHIATKNKTVIFRKWLVESWSKKYAENNDGPSTQAYMKLMRAAHAAGAQTNTIIDTPESRLLLQLLDARNAAVIGGIDSSSMEVWNLAMNLLCSDFQPPPPYRYDILGKDSEATKHIADVLKPCNISGVHENYILWAARVLGRASRTNIVDFKAMTSDKRILQLHEETDGDHANSRKLIVESVTRLLFSDNRTHAGLAEECLRSILFKSETQVDRTEFLQQYFHDPAKINGSFGLGTPDVVVTLTDDHVLPPHVEQCFRTENTMPFSQWLRHLTIALVSSSTGDPIVGSLRRIISGVDGLAELLFPSILHLLLEKDLSGSKKIQQTLSACFRTWFSTPPASSLAHVKALIKSILYLREQSPRVSSDTDTHFDRLAWLDIDFSAAAQAAEQCGMYTTALLFAEISTSGLPAKSTRRSALTFAPPISDISLLAIFRNVDDPDSFYGVPQTPSLDLVLDRLDHEGDGAKSLLYRGARLDSHMRRTRTLSAIDNGGMVRTLVNMNMNALTYKVLSGEMESASGVTMVDSILQSATKLGQWDVRAPERAQSEPATLYTVFQSLNNATSVTTMRKSIDRNLLLTMRNIVSSSEQERAFRSSLSTLDILTEIDDVLASTSSDQFSEVWKDIQARDKFLVGARSEKTKSILTNRELMFDALCWNSVIRDSIKVGLRDVRVLQVEALASSLRIWKKRHAWQESLSTATYLSDLVPACAEVDLDIKIAAQNAIADVLWTQGEVSTSVQMLQDIIGQKRSKDENPEIHRSSLLAKLGHHAAEARLEQPDQIMNTYLIPAIAELKKSHTSGRIAGQVYHQFATFCDEQLRNSDAVEDFKRSEKIRNRRKAEVEVMSNDLKANKSQSELKDKKREFDRARKWYRLDNQEYERLRKSRESFMMQSLENYLLSLSSSDEFDNDTLRFYALWLEHAESHSGNQVVAQQLDKVASHKFVRLMNQLSSRLQADNTPFQVLLADLVFRICKDHPYHGMHFITAGTHDPGNAEEAIGSRYAATRSIAARLQVDLQVSGLWKRIHDSDRLYHKLASYAEDSLKRAGREFRLSDFRVSKQVQTDVPTYKLPPPTLSIPVRADLNYNAVPKVIGFRSKMRVAGGLSAPKIITSHCSDGTEFKQLFKGGSDDLRQDAIMEQVFEEVGKLLANHTSTQQRNLQIRTYNVLPLSNHSGVLEFVQNTIALQDCLIDLHARYFPKDLKSTACRTKIDEAARESTDTRIKTYKDVCKQFNPAMRFFFFERFSDPDVWFQKRLAYTRSTAAISILGHIIGLGDRHLHNILLDQYTGEIVHIDLGVCFEAGRVLPIPEVVPFRLTRDLVDGMGYTRTEGVFRRCCEFTLDALREERESIMTLLNVLRYDPLYSWTVSAAKARRLQEADDVPNRVAEDNDIVREDHNSRKVHDEGAEAGRALATVEKKLSKVLSKEAMVSELIAQATDERNLALLFCGWSAWV